MKLIPTELPGVFVLEPKVFGDDRGFFLESYNTRVFEELGIKTTFVQDNHSRSSKGVLRGLHYQLVHPQAKLVRVTSGTVFDVAVDIRRRSPTFGRWYGAFLSDENKRMMYVPEGFAHGFYVVSDSADFLYKCSDFYYPKGDRGIAWNDPEIGIDWPFPPEVAPTLSAKDLAHPKLGDVPVEDLPALDPSETGASS